MVERALFLLLSLCCAVAAGASTPAATNETAGKRPEIKKVIIERNGAWSDKRSSSPEPPESCRDFLLKESDVRRFFKIARFSTSHEHVHDLDVSRCHATGRVVLRDGQEATWLIDRARLGVLTFSSGRSQYFFCGKCRSPVYWEPCDIDCIHSK